MMSLIRSIKPLIIAVGAFWVMTGTMVHAEILDRVVAKVNGEIITLSAVEERVAILKLKISGAGGAVPESEELMGEALDIMINEKLQIQDGQKRGFEVEEESVLKFLDDIKGQNRLTDAQLDMMLRQEGRTLESYKGHLRNQIMVSKVMQFHMGGTVKIANKDIENYYDHHQDDFLIPPKIVASHILLLLDDSLTPQERRFKEIKAREILKQIRAGKDFARLAEKYSEDVSARSGGEIGIVEKGKMVPEFEEAVYKLGAGEVSDIVKTRYGLHIIKNDRIIRGSTRPLDEVKAQIENFLTAQAQKKKYDDWVSQMRKAAYIEVSLKESPEKKTPVNLESATKTADFSRKKSSARKKMGSRPRLIREEGEDFGELSESTSSQNSRIENSDLGDLGKKLQYYKKLRDKRKITEREYQNKKTQLLNQL